MNPLNKVRWGIAGTGRISHQFAEDFAHVPNGKVVAVSSRSQESANTFARQHGIERAYAGYENLLADPEIDAVYIASPHTMHFQDTIDAIQAGKHVLCEKPFTINPDESRQLFETAGQSPVFVMEAMWTFFLPAIQKAQEWLAQGRIGKLHQIKADFGYPQLPYDPNRREYNAEFAGGCLLEMGIYPVSLAWLFMQQDPTGIQTFVHKAPNGVEDDLVMLFDYADSPEGATATLATSFRSKLQNWAYIIGEEGYIAIPDFWRANACSLYHLDTRVDHFEDERQSLGLNYETIAANEDILAGRQQSNIMPWSNTIRFQEHMNRIRQLF
jgi:predicted dehydrogenase